MQRVFSGIQPTGLVHLGNYLGAIRNWVKLQNEYDTIYSIVDLHALTVEQDPKQFPQQVLDLAIDYLALGIDPEQSILFVQSHVPEHTELAWILNTLTPMNELQRMTQFKDKSTQHTKNINVGLFDYPVLMAADILLYKAEKIPVGEDQVQHVELARTITRKFNTEYGDTFPEPEPLLTSGARIMGLDGDNKMSKSKNNYIGIFEDPETISKKVMKAKTDSGSEITDLKPSSPPPSCKEISNLAKIYMLLSGKEEPEVVTELQGMKYGEFKKLLSQTISEKLEPFRAKRDKLAKEPDHIKSILANGAKRASEIAVKNMAEVKSKVGLTL